MPRGRGIVAEQRDSLGNGVPVGDRKASRVLLSLLHQPDGATQLPGEDLHITEDQHLIRITAHTKLDTAKPPLAGTAGLAGLACGWYRRKRAAAAA